MAGKKRHLILGAGNAGMNAARRLRRLRPEDEIILFSKEELPPYCRCLLTYVLEGKLSRDELLRRGREEITELELDYRPGCEIVAVEPENCAVHTAAGERIAGDTMLLATGGEPERPTFPGANLPGIFTLRRLADLEAMTARIRPGAVWAVAGAGLVSLKTIGGLAARGVRVELYARSQRILSQVLDDEAAARAAARLEAHGVTIHTGTEISAAAPAPQNRLRLTLTDGRALEVDGLLYGKGVKAAAPAWQTTTKKQPATAPNEGNGFAVDDCLRLAERVFAAGDTVRVLNLASGRRERLALWPLAGEQGRLVAWNQAQLAAGRPESRLLRYPGGLPGNAFSLFGLDFISAGQRTFPPAVTDWEKSCQATPATYRRLNLQAGRLRGFILCGRPAILEAGPLYARIRREALAANPG